MHLESLRYICVTLFSCKNSCFDELHYNLTFNFNSELLSKSNKKQRKPSILHNKENIKQILYLIISIFKKNNVIFYIQFIWRSSHKSVYWFNPVFPSPYRHSNGLVRPCAVVAGQEPMAKAVTVHTWPVRRAGRCEASLHADAQEPAHPAAGPTDHGHEDRLQLRRIPCGHGPL